MQEQDSIFSRLFKERTEFKRERAAVDAELQTYSENFSTLSAQLVHDRHAALGTLRELDAARCFNLVKEWNDLCSKIADHTKHIVEMGGE